MRADPGRIGPKRTSWGQPGKRGNVPIAGRTAPLTPYTSSSTTSTSLPGRPKVGEGFLPQAGPGQNNLTTLMEARVRGVGQHMPLDLRMRVGKPSLEVAPNRPGQHGKRREGPKR